mgnify:CR=1 FL=1
MLITEKNLMHFCLIEVRAMVVAVQQTLAECTAFSLSVLSNNAHLPVHKPCTDQLWSRFQNSAYIQDQRSMCWQHQKHFDLSQ